MMRVRAIILAFLFGLAFVAWQIPSFSKTGLPAVIIIILVPGLAWVPVVWPQAKLDEQIVLGSLLALVLEPFIFVIANRLGIPLLPLPIALLVAALAALGLSLGWEMESRTRHRLR